LLFFDVWIVISPINRRMHMKAESFLMALLALIVSAMHVAPAVGLNHPEKEEKR
jgi:uncharacterized membrane protein